MTTGQRKKHKLGNQVRKAAILAKLNHNDIALRGFSNILGGFQDGKQTKFVKDMLDNQANNV